MDTWPLGATTTRKGFSKIGVFRVRPWIPAWMPMETRRIVSGVATRLMKFSSLSAAPKAGRISRARGGVR